VEQKAAGEGKSLHNRRAETKPAEGGGKKDRNTRSVVTNPNSVERGLNPPRRVIERFGSSGEIEGSLRSQKMSEWKRWGEGVVHERR